MVTSIKNGHGATAVSLVKGSGVANRHANKHQLAALAAAILKGDVTFEPSMRQLAQLLGVNVSYIGVALKLSPAERAKIIAGEEAISFTDLLHGPTKPLALPAPKIVTDEALEAIVRCAGIDRTLNAAVAVETHA